MRVGELKKEMDQQFAKVDEQFARIQKRFEKVDERFAQVDARIVEMEARIAAEGEATRRHFDIVAEQMDERYRLQLDQLMAMNGRIDRHEAEYRAQHERFLRRLENHEVRIKTLESVRLPPI